jgi:ADP-ribose pyrophosphatase YjhB (NUDIX family)
MKEMRINSLGIILHENKILAQKGTDPATGKVFWRLPGGGIEFGETSSEALAREFLEEIGVGIKNEKLLTVVENIFAYNNTVGHEITFLYQAELADAAIYSKEIIKKLDKENDSFEWVKVAGIKSGETILYPQASVQYL